VSRRNPRNGLLAIVGNLGWPMLLGAAATSLFYVLVYRGPLNVPAMHRYFASHPVAFVATSMFFVGLAALALKLIEVLIQFWAANLVRLEDPPQGGEAIEAVPARLEQLAQLPEAACNSYLGRRLRDGLRFVQRQGGADQLNDELKYLADMDAVRQHDSFALVRILIWATPMLGFLGTVVGITQALGDLDARQLATDIQGAMDGLLSGLYVAFDTTALALSLSIILMFLMFLIDRMENQVLSAVDLQAAELLAGRFQQVGSGQDPYLNSIGRMCQQVIASSETLVQRQTELWQTTLQAGQQQWAQLVNTSGAQVQTALQAALDHSLTSHAERMAELDARASQRVQQHWEQLQAALTDNARTMQGQQRELIRQGEVMVEVARATGNLITLEKSLNENLEALAGARNFEETLLSLSAAIHLMSARLGAAPGKAAYADLKHPISKERAA
jgi:biopolymer transport protein ExbB/TolQ